MSFPRALTEVERSVALRVLELSKVKDLEHFRGQLAVAIATEPCPCVCPTIAIAVDARRAEAASYSGKPIAEAYYDGGAVMVWAEEGWLSNLEIWWRSDEAPTQFPALIGSTRDSAARRLGLLASQ